MQTAKAKMPVRPRVESTMVLADNNNKVSEMEAMAKGAPCEMMRCQEGRSPSNENVSVSRLLAGFHQ